MMLTNEAVATAFRVLDKCSAEVKPRGPWRWQCVVQNGVRLRITAAVEDGFLHLAGHPEARGGDRGSLANALHCNGTLAGGVKFALNAAGRDLHLCTDIVLLEETRLLPRIHWAFSGFHEGNRRLNSVESRAEEKGAPIAVASGVNLGDVLRETTWSWTERGRNDFSVDLREGFAPPVRINSNEHGVALSLELIRCDRAANVTLQALTIFLLTANGALRLVRAHTLDQEGQQAFGFQVALPAAPAEEEIDHALAALAVAHRMCAREANVLLDAAAARFYLSARDHPTIQNSNDDKEN